MSVLNDVLFEEYNRLGRVIERTKKEYDSLPPGYISKKNIRGTTRYYLQYREKDKIKSVYLKAEEVEYYNILIERRRHLRKVLKSLELDRKKLEKVLM